MAEPVKSESIKGYDPEPEYHVDAALAKLHKDSAKKAAFDAKVALRKAAQAIKRR